MKKILFSLGLVLMAATAAFSQTGSRVRFVHAIPDAGSVDVYVDGQLAWPALQYGSYGSYLNVVAGQHEVDVTAAGTFNLVAVTVEVVDFGVDKTVVGAGYVNSSDGPSVVSFLDNSLNPDLGAARLRLVQASKAAGPVDLYLSAGAGSGSQIDPTAALATAVALGTGTAYLSVAADLPTQADATATGDVQILSASKPTSLKAGSVMTMLLVDTVDKTGAPAAPAFLMLLDRQVDQTATPPTTPDNSDQ